FNHTPPSHIYTLSLHDALPICLVFRTAGDRALALNAFATAARFYRLALDLWPRDDPECAYVLFGLGVARNHAEYSVAELEEAREDRKSTRLNSSHRTISYAVFC